MRQAEPPQRVILYGRVSLDRDERSKSVDDQLAELTRWATREGWTIVGTFRDDGISASRFAHARDRPGWQDATSAITSGQVDAVLTWEISRASRDRPAFAALFGACADAGVRIGTGGRLHDLDDPEDGFSLDLGAALAVRESAMLSRRVRRASESRAAAGRPAGSVPFGYRKVVDIATGRTVGRDVHPEQGPVVQEIVRRLLALEPAIRIADDLNARGIPTGTGVHWRGTNLRKLATRPTYAALRVHRGQVLDGVRATWPPLITEADHYALLAMFADPGRDKYRSDTRTRHLLTGLARCGRPGCDDGRMRVVLHPTREPAYACRDCRRVSRSQARVDELVNTAMWRRLAQPDVLELLAAAAGDDGDARAAAAEATRLRGKLREARQLVDDDRLSLESLADLEARLLPKIRTADERARPRSLPPVVYDVATPEAERRWFDLSIIERRTLVAALLDVVVLPVGRGQWRWDPRSVEITWRT